MTAQDVAVKVSRIPGAGNGLFADRDFNSGELVCEYTGKALTFLQALKTEDKTYMMGGFGLNLHLDAKDCPESMGRYINDPRNPAMVNVRFDKRKDLKKALVVATRDVKVRISGLYRIFSIQAGAEIFVSYGESYWRKHAGTIMQQTEN